MMHRYFVTTIYIDTADPVYRCPLETICTDIVEKFESKHIGFFWSDWCKYSDITWQSHVLFQLAAVVVVGTPFTGVAGCAQCSWSQVSLLSCYSRCPSGILLCLDMYWDMYRIATSVSRYESYCEAPVSLHPYCLHERYITTTKTIKELDCSPIDDEVKEVLKWF